jgi:hypothetical protein
MKLGIGISDFRKIIEADYYYVDKSLFIKDVLDDTEVILITRPRRFGKTLNLSMLKHFFAKEVLNQPTAKLKVVSSEQRPQGLWCHLKIPNQEIRDLYQTLIEEWLSDGYGIEWYYEFLEDLLTGRMSAFERHLQVIYQQIISVHDVAHYPEAFYHGLILGLVASLNRKEYEVRSNRESGYGRYDLAIIPSDPQKLVILMEFKKAEEDNLQQTAELALQQIDEKQYAAEFSPRGVHKVLKIGISFCRKKICVISA